MTKLQAIVALHERLCEYIIIDKRGTDITGRELTHDTRICISSKIGEIVNALELLGMHINLDLYYGNSK